MPTLTPQKKPITGPVARRQSYLASFMALVMALALGVALALEKWGGIMPCKLCLQERLPYYSAIPILLIVVGLCSRRMLGLLVRLLFISVAALMFYNFVLSVYHAGVEYQFWQGPSDCAVFSRSISQNTTDLLSQLNTVRPPSCDRAAGVFLGLSFAGWNALLAIFLGVSALFAACVQRKK